MRCDGRVERSQDREIAARRRHDHSDGLSGLCDIHFPAEGFHGDEDVVQHVHAVGAIERHRVEMSRKDTPGQSVREQRRSKRAVLAVGQAELGRGQSDARACRIDAGAQLRRRCARAEQRSRSQACDHGRGGLRRGCEACEEKTDRESSSDVTHHRQDNGLGCAEARSYFGPPSLHSAWPQAQPPVDCSLLRHASLQNRSPAPSFTTQRQASCAHVVLNMSGWFPVRDGRNASRASARPKNRALRRFPRGPRSRTRCARLDRRRTPARLDRPRRDPPSRRTACP